MGWRYFANWQKDSLSAECQRAVLPIGSVSLTFLPIDSASVAEMGIGRVTGILALKPNGKAINLNHGSTPTDTGQHPTEDQYLQLFIIKANQYKFLQQIVNGDEKWVVYVNHTRNCQWINQGELPEPEPKADLHPKKVMLSIWWDFQDIIYYEVLPPNTTIDSELYCKQLQNVKVALQAKRPERHKVRLLHDNARPHVSKVTR